jgi:hypothetical protein
MWTNAPETDGALLIENREGLLKGVMHKQSTRMIKCAGR